MSDPEEYQSVIDPLTKINTIGELLNVYRKWLYFEDDEAYTIEVPLAVAKEREVPGDPIWIYLIAPPGGRKTEQVRALSKYHRIYTIDTLTPQTFISGKTAKDKETGEHYPIAGILHDLDGRILVIKDFTAVLSMPEIVRSELYGQLRAIHDGYYEKGFGTLPEPIRVKASLGLIACVTPVIDKYTKAHSALGERFLKLRIRTDADKASKRAYENAEKARLMRHELSLATAGFLSNLKIDKEHLPQLDTEQDKMILAMGKYISLMRCRVYCKYYRGDIVDMDYTEPELPTRVCKQLKKLAVLLAIIRGHDLVMSSEIDTLLRVAFDTSIPRRQMIMETMIKIAAPMPAGDIAGHAKLHRKTSKNELEKMQALGIIEPIAVGEGEKQVTFFQLTEMFHDVVIKLGRISNPEYVYFREMMR